jgi:signal transduction histidine kinase
MSDREERPVTGAPAHTEQERWERFAEPLFAAIPYGLLTIATTLSVAMRPQEGGSLLIDLVASAAIAVWSLWWVTLHPQWRCSRWRGPVFFVGWAALAGFMVTRAPWFGFYTFSGYLYTAWVLRDRWQIPGVLTTAVLTATAQNGGLPGWHADELLVYGLIVLLNASLASFLAHHSAKTDRQNEDRREVILELAAANDQLERSLALNAELQEQLLDRAREAGMLGERQRMAGEIHDTLAQALVGIITQLEAIDQARDVDPDAATGEGIRGAAADGETSRRVGVAAQLAREALGEARRSVQALRPAPLESARLPEALAQVADRWSKIHGVDAAVTTHGPVAPLRPELEVTMLRTAQEALANVARHAQARRVGITLSYMDDLVTLDVRDDGIGFDPAGARKTAIAETAAVAATDAWNPLSGRPRPARRTAPATAASADADAAPAGGFGLIAMRERIQGVAGTLAIESEPGHGTAVSATVPALRLGAA